MPHSSSYISNPFHPSPPLTQLIPKHWERHPRPPTMPLGLANSGSANTYAQLRNNAAPWWFMDAGMRKLSLAICVGFMSTINGGKSSHLLDLAYCSVWSCTDTQATMDLSSMVSSPILPSCSLSTTLTTPS